MIRRKAHNVCLSPLCRGLQHVFDKDAVACRWVVHKDMCHRAHQLSVLNNRRAGHVCVKYRTKFFYKFLRILRTPLSEITSTGEIEQLFRLY